MGSNGTCRECGTAIPAGSPGGFCAQCLLRLGLETADRGDEGVVAPNPPEEQPRLNESTPPSSDQDHNSLRASVPLTEKPGDRIGRYRLFEEIGHGGCGVVYLAEQEEPVRRKVALKVIKLGMDTRQVVARFEAERQALAMMDHPNIATVLDAGATETGRPYFVMELVGGIKITDFCKQNHLTTLQRLNLFIQVCRAIQHAHQKGIIHRDIKPSNVLVSAQDGLPVPKVIDFGIAKATQGRLADQTVFTAFEQFLGTPAYMSPEQAQLGGLDVDTRSDVYSLGVLLYELLTGKTPFDSKELLGGGLDAMRRTIQEKEPLTPSTRLSQESLANRMVSSSKSEAADPKPKIHKDLDWIVMKCLEKDRARRYETATGLVMDIERHLNNEPVLAGPPSNVYRFQKLVRRNKLTFTAATAVLAALVAGVAISAWQAVRATRAERVQSWLREQAQSAQRNEVRERQKAQAALTQMEAIEVRRAEEYYMAGDRHNMLPYLALVLRQNPGNRIAAERLISTLSHRTWARLACPPLVHSNRLTWAMFSRDGTRVVTSSADNTARIWDSRDGRCVAGPFIHSAEINNADFSPDGRFIVTASEDKTARVWDTYNSTVVTPPLQHHSSVFLAKFSPKGGLVLTISENAGQLWSSETAERVGQDFDSGHIIMDARFSPDGSRVAMASGTEAQVWDVSSGICLQKFSHADEVKCVAFSPDGKWLVSGAKDQTARVWDLKTGLAVCQPLRHQGDLMSAEFSPDGGRVITASCDHTAQIWESRTGRRLGPPLKHDFGVRSAMFSPEGARIVTSSPDKTVRVWDALSGSSLTEPLVLDSSAFYAEFHCYGERILTVSNGKTALIWETIRTAGLTLFFPEAVESLEFSPDGKKIVTASDGDHTRVWDAWSGEALTPPLAGTARRRIARAIFSPDGKRVATLCSDDGTVRVWSASEGQPVTQNLAHDGQISHMSFSPDGTRLLTTSARETRIWDTASGKLLLMTRTGNFGEWASFSPDGETFLSIPEPHVARVLNSRTGQPMSPPLNHTAAITSAMFSPDGCWVLAAAGENTFIIWDIKTGRRLGRSWPHREPVLNAVYSRDGKNVLSSTVRYGAQLWDIEAGSFLSGEVADAMDSTVKAALFCGDEKRIAVVDNYDTARLWDTASGQRLTESFPSGKDIVCARCSADGQLVAFSAKDDRKVTIWETPGASLPIPDWLPELAEALAGQKFNTQGLLEAVQPAELWTVQQRMAAWANGPDTTADSSYKRWAKWFLADPSTRTVLPSSSAKLGDYVRVLLEQGTAESCGQALLLQPTNCLALARVGGRVSDLVLAEWMTQRAVEMGPECEEAWRQHAAVLFKAWRPDEAFSALARACAIKANKPRTISK